MRHYRRENHTFDLFRGGYHLPRVVRTYDGIRVAQGDFRLLRLTLLAGLHDSVATHCLTRGFWKAFTNHRSRLSLAVWAHGSEAQPWLRRPWTAPDEASRKKARRISSRQFKSWRAFLEDPLTRADLVFVSQHQAHQVLHDLDLTRCTAAVHIIPNPIDTSLFPYQAKKPEQRFRILSVRPFNNALYANDLTVKAILALASRPDFQRFEFTIVGDGALFESTVLPLRGFPNIHLRQGFVPQDELPALHREHGVFLCPSRTDTHGVSRDEAMSSGLVPITTKTSAIPEFVDDQCGLLVEPEDPQALADMVIRLGEQPDLFRRLSEGAASRVRRTSAAPIVIPGELAILRNNQAQPPPPAVIRTRQFRIALYADVNPNVIDGSSIWLASVAEILGRWPGVSVTLFLKAPLQRTLLLEPLLKFAESLRIVEPDIPEGTNLTLTQAAEAVGQADARKPFDAVILRGRQLCLCAASTVWAGKVWAYLTDIPQTLSAWTTRDLNDLHKIATSCRWLLCQTQALADHLADVTPDLCSRLRLLPPAIPTHPIAAPSSSKNRPFRLVYAGKFARAWGVEEMLAAHDRVRQRHPSAECHVYGDKFHASCETPEFVPSMREALNKRPGIVWHGAASRDQVLRALPGMHAAWAFRHSSLESATLELSTKLLEYAAAGVPPVCARNKVNENLLGTDYPYFADTPEEAFQQVLRLAEVGEPSPQAVKDRMFRGATAHSFEAVGELLAKQGLIPARK
jgi:glycosyltransferase involved in cell wall biosynthesis